MKKMEYVGIDISKEKIDVRLYFVTKGETFDNKPAGLKKMKSWVDKHIDQQADLLFCFEHTGIYAYPLRIFLAEQQLNYVQVSGLQVKRSLGIQRGKNDRVDAKRLADYVYQHREKITPQKLETAQLIRLKCLLALRARMVRQRAGYMASVKEYQRYLSLKKSDTIINGQQEMIKSLTVHIERIEQDMKTVIASEEKILKSFELATSVKGIGPVSASYFIVLTNCFTEFKTWRKFACYAGSAPFEHQSGTSVMGRTRISHYANKQMKTILTNAVKAAVRYSPEMRQYYQRRIAEGKHKKVVVNIIRNKLISRVFATVRRGTPYVELAKYAA
jgi:transposase